MAEIRISLTPDHVALLDYLFAHDVGFEIRALVKTNTATPWNVVAWTIYHNASPVPAGPNTVRGEAETVAEAIWAIMAQAREWEYLGYITEYDEK